MASEISESYIETHGMSPARCEKCSKILFLAAETVIITTTTIIVKRLDNPLVMT